MTHSARAGNLEGVVYESSGELRERAKRREGAGGHVRARVQAQDSAGPRTGVRHARPGVARECSGSGTTELRGTYSSRILLSLGLHYRDARGRYRDPAPKLDSSQLNFIALHIRLTPLPAIIGRFVTDSSGIVLTNRLHHCIQCHVLYLLLQFCFVVFFFFFFLWVTRYLSMQDGCNPKRKSPPAPLTTGFHDCCQQAHHNLDGLRRNCEWLSEALHPHHQCIPRTFSCPTERQPRTRLLVVGSASTILQ